MTANGDSPELSDELVAYYQQVLVAHTTNPETGVCAVCGVPRCPDWVSAFDTLAAAGQVMATAPPRWEPFRLRIRPQAQPSPRAMTSARKPDDEDPH